jgi:cytochrome c biogenesis protein CcmG/thiol:disulfide interchange protein DsbE
MVYETVKPSNRRLGAKSGQLDGWADHTVSPQSPVRFRGALSMSATVNLRRRMSCALAAASLMAILTGPVLAKQPIVGQPAPDFQLTTLDGKQIAFADLKGQVIVLNFWATWCGPCRTELPLLETYYRVQKAFGLRVFAVMTEDSAPAYQLKPLAAVLTMPLIRRIRGPYDALRGEVPTNYVIDRAGVLRYAKAGAFSLDDLNTILVPLLNDPAPPTAAPVAATSTSLAQAGRR